MKSANLSCGFMALLLLASVLFARPAAAFQEMDILGCGTSWYNPNGSPPDMNKWIFYPARSELSSQLNNNYTAADRDAPSNYQLGTGTTSSNPILITSQDLQPGQLIMPQDFSIYTYCEKSGNHINTASPYLWTDETNNHSLNDQLKKHGLKLQFMVKDSSISGWHDIDAPDAHKVELKGIPYDAYIDNEPSSSVTGPFKTHYSKQGLSANRGTPVTLSLRLVTTTGKVNPIQTAINEQINFGTLFFITADETGLGTKITINNTGHLTFTIAQCKAQVTLSNTNLDFGTLTQYKMGQAGVQAGRIVNITLSKSNSCAEGAMATAGYAIPRIRVRFIATDAVIDQYYSTLQGEDNLPFPGLALSVIKCNGYICGSATETNRLPFEQYQPFLYVNSLEDSFIGGAEDNASQYFKFVIDKYPASISREEIGTGMFHTSVRVEVTYN